MEAELSIPLLDVDTSQASVEPCSQMLPTDDQNLVQNARHDRDGFAQLYRLHYQPIAQYLYRRTGHTHATEDLVGEVFFTALGKLPHYEDRGTPIRAWLYRIATNAANNWARKQRRELRRIRGAHDKQRTRSSYSPSRPPEVLRALHLLSPKHQTVLTLHHLSGLSIEQIALVLSISPGTVKSRLSRAREAMRRNLKEEGAT